MKVAVSLPRGGCSVALVVLVGLDLQSRPHEYEDYYSATTMYRIEMAQMAIKQQHLRYPTDDD